MRLCTHAPPAADNAAGNCLRVLLTVVMAGGPYAIFAGRDASRGLAKQSFEADMLTPVDEPIDSLDDLTSSEWDNLKDWERQYLSFPRRHVRCRSESGQRN